MDLFKLETCHSSWSSVVSERYNVDHTFIRNSAARQTDDIGFKRFNTQVREQLSRTYRSAKTYANGRLLSTLWSLQTSLQFKAVYNSSIHTFDISRPIGTLPSLQPTSQTFSKIKHTTTNQAVVFSLDLRGMLQCRDLKETLCHVYPCFEWDKASEWP